MLDNNGKETHIDIQTVRDAYNAYEMSKSDLYDAKTILRMGLHIYFFNEKCDFELELWSFRNRINISWSEL